MHFIWIHWNEQIIPFKSNSKNDNLKFNKNLHQVNMRCCFLLLLLNKLLWIFHIQTSWQYTEWLIQRKIQYWFVGRKNANFDHFSGIFYPLILFFQKKSISAISVVFLWLTKGERAIWSDLISVRIRWPCTVKILSTEPWIRSRHAFLKCLKMCRSFWPNCMKNVTECLLITLYQRKPVANRNIVLN